MSYLDYLHRVAVEDVEELKRKDETYGSSWKKRGGVGAFMMAARKMDRLDKQMKDHGYDIFAVILNELARGVKDGVYDDARDLRRYLTLIEAEVLRILDNLPRCVNHMTRIDCPLKVRVLNDLRPADDGLCASCHDRGEDLRPPRDDELDARRCDVISIHGRQCLRERRAELGLVAHDGTHLFTVKVTEVLTMPGGWMGYRGDWDDDVQCWSANENKDLCLIEKGHSGPHGWPRRCPECGSLEHVASLCDNGG